MRRYYVEFDIPNDIGLADEFDAKNFAEAVKKANETRAEQRIGTRITMLIEKESYDVLIKAFHTS